MSENKCRVAVIGAGAVGCLSAAVLTKSGFDVTLVSRHREVTDAIEQHGIAVTGVCESFTAPVSVCSHIEQLKGEFDLCLIATRAYDLADAARRMLNHLQPNSLCLSMQSGICVDDLANIVGADRAAGCSLRIRADKVGTNRVELTSTGEIVFGTVTGHGSPLLGLLMEGFRPVAATRISANIYAELYSRMIIAGSLTTLCAISGLHPSEIMRHWQGRHIFISVTEEALRVARNIGFHVPPFGRVNYEELIVGRSWVDKLRRYFALQRIARRFIAQRSNSLLSLSQGRPAETDWYTGYVVRKGQEFGAPCPVSERLTVMVREIVAGKRGASLSNLDDPTLIQS